MVKKVKTKLNKNVKLCAVVKANAYGHDIVKTALAIQNEVDYFAVARVDEGLVLRQNQITKPILVLNPCYTKNQAEICAKNIKYSVKKLTNSLQIYAKVLEKGKI